MTQEELKAIMASLTAIMKALQELLDRAPKFKREN